MAERDSIPEGIDRRLLLDEIEAFLIAELALLDAGDLAGWRELFTEDGTYWAPARPDQANPLDEISLFYDDRSIMALRAERLAGPREQGRAPAPRTSHMVSNVELAGFAEGRRPPRGAGALPHAGIPAGNGAAQLRRPLRIQPGARGGRFAHRRQEGDGDQLRRRVLSAGDAVLRAASAWALGSRRDLAHTDRRPERRQSRRRSRWQSPMRASSGPAPRPIPRSGSRRVASAIPTTSSAMSSARCGSSSMSAASRRWRASCRSRPASSATATPTTISAWSA